MAEDRKERMPSARVDLNKALHKEVCDSFPGEWTPAFEDSSCGKCWLALDCLYAFDPYNTRGECLADDELHIP